MELPTLEFSLENMVDFYSVDAVQRGLSEKAPNYYTITLAIGICNKAVRDRLEARDARYVSYLDDMEQLDELAQEENAIFGQLIKEGRSDFEQACSELMSIYDQAGIIWNRMHEKYEKEDPPLKPAREGVDDTVKKVLDKVIEHFKVLNSIYVPDRRNAFFAQRIETKEL